MSNTDCVECRNRLVPSGSYTFRGAELGCRECHLLYAVALGPEGISLTFVGGPCAYCGTHTADGCPCASVGMPTEAPSGSVESSTEQDDAQDMRGAEVRYAPPVDSGRPYGERSNHAREG